MRKTTKSNVKYLSRVCFLFQVSNSSVHRNFEGGVGGQRRESF